MSIDRRRTFNCCAPLFDCCPPSWPLQWCYGFYVTHQQGHAGFELFFKTRELKKKWLEQFEMAMWVSQHASRTIVPSAGTRTPAFAFVCVRGIPRPRWVLTLSFAMFDQGSAVIKRTLSEKAWSPSAMWAHTNTGTHNCSTQQQHCGEAALCLCWFTYRAFFSTAISTALIHNSGNNTV